MKLIVECVVWHDAAKTTRALLNTNPIILATIGAVLHENKKEVILACEVEHIDGFVGKELDYQQIPKRVILARKVVGEVDLPLPLRKRVPKKLPKEDLVPGGGP